MKDLSHRFIIHLCQKIFTVLIIQYILYFSDSSSSELELDEQKSRITASKIIASKMIASRMTASKMIASRIITILICMKTY